MKLQVKDGRLEFYGSPEECAQFAAAWSGKNLVPKPDESWIAAQAPPCLEPAPTPAPQGDPGILVDALRFYCRTWKEDSKHHQNAKAALDAYAASVPRPAPDPERVRLLEEVASKADDLREAIGLSNLDHLTQEEIYKIRRKFSHLGTALEALHAH